MAPQDDDLSARICAALRICARVFGALPLGELRGCTAVAADRGATRGCRCDGMLGSNRKGEAVQNNTLIMVSSGFIHIRVFQQELEVYGRSRYKDMRNKKNTVTFAFSPNSLLLGVLNALKNGRLGAGRSGRVPGRLVSHFLSFVSQFFSFVSQLGGSRLACLPLPFICLPLLFICLPLLFNCLLVLFICLSGWVLVVGFPAGLSPTSFHLSPRLGACGRVPGRLVSHFFSGWVLLVRLPAGLSPTSFHLSPTSFHLSPRLCACSRVSGRLVSHFLAFVSHFFPKQFTVRGCHFFLKMCPPFVSLLVSAHFHWPCSISIHLPGLSLLVSALFRWPCSISIHLSPRSVIGGVRPWTLAM